MVPCLLCAQLTVSPPRHPRRGEREEGEWESHLNLSMIPASRSAVTVQV